MSTFAFDTVGPAYERFMGRWSRLFLPAVVEAAGVQPAQRVLDLAAGTGEGAVAAIDTASGVRVVAVDVSAPMLAATRAKTIGRPVSVAVMDGQALACRSASFDAAICMLGLMFFPDPMKGAAELHRVLRPGARVAVCVWGPPDRAPFPGILLEVLSRHLPDQRQDLFASFTLADCDRLRAVLASGGFADVTVRRETHRIVFEGFDDFWEPVAAGGARASQALHRLSETGRVAVREEVRGRMARFECDGRLVMDTETLLAVGRR